MDNTIYVPRILTSAQFFENFTNQWESREAFHCDDFPIVLDFSNTAKIEPVCLSYILTLGNNIEMRTGVPVRINIPDTFEGGAIKFYLWEMGFLANSKILKSDNVTRRTIFEYETSPYGGAEGKKVDPVCGVFYYDSCMSESQLEYTVSENLSPFVAKYLGEFEYNEDEEQGDLEHEISSGKGRGGNNIIQSFITETVKNSIIHGKSYVYVAIHGRYSDHRIYISVSDYGMGFLEAWKTEKRELLEKEKLSEKERKNLKEIVDTEKKYNNNKEPQNEFEAIICGLYKRDESKAYGLYSVIQKVLQKGKKYQKSKDERTAAVVRIHSNNTQIVFTSRVEEFFMKGNLLGIPNFKTYNLKNNRNFRGVHIEIEMPFGC